ncbi:MAG: hypothetical protein D6677_07025 [Calditrichaeota bacterium]|nr:MAG: hypothetical protein D6677_07025 [Calditrichota bacterium]
MAITDSSCGNKLADKFMQTLRVCQNYFLKEVVEQLKMASYLVSFIKRISLIKLKCNIKI